MPWDKKMGTLGARFSWIVAALGIAFLCAGIVLASEWKPVELKFPKVDDQETSNITAVGIVGADQVYVATSRSRLYRWNGKDLEEIKHNESGDPAWTVRNIVVNSEDDIWVFGDNGLSMRFDGKTWKQVRNPLTGTGKRNGRLWGAACAKADLCFAGSHSGRLIKWDGKEWDEVNSPADDARIYGIQFTAPDSGWMLGEGFFARWDGKSWQKAGLKEVPRMYDLALVGQDWGWAVGDAGAIFAYDGLNWWPMKVKGSLFRLRGIACPTKVECWAVGEAGVAFKWDGSRWERVKLGVVDRLTTVQMAASTNLIGGDKATFLRYREEGHSSLMENDVK